MSELLHHTALGYSDSDSNERKGRSFHYQKCLARQGGGGAGARPGLVIILRGTDCELIAFLAPASHPRHTPHTVITAPRQILSLAVRTGDTPARPVITSFTFQRFRPFQLSIVHHTA